MSQLVGRNCAVCRGRIAAELNARFCGCGRPVHDRCAGKRAAKAAPADCPGCGLPRTDGAAPADGAPAPRPSRAAGFVILAGSAVVVLGGLVLLATSGREAGDVAVGGGVLATGLAGAAWGAVRAFR